MSIKLRSGATAKFHLRPLYEVIATEKAESNAAPSRTTAERSVPAPPRLEQPTEPLRSKVVEMMTKVFVGAECARERALEVEDAMNALAKFDQAKYKDVFKTLKMNLSRNEELKESVLERSLSCHELVRMDPKQMATKEHKDRLAGLIKESWKAAQVADVPMAETDEFQCGKCRKRRCVYFQKQTRSADEPMTTFVSCKECGNQWRFS
eukprot:TRINITY_DN10394_c0_g1_i2.p1 TRINITY_DN10394_c0_g1~~TRINITY_DN10394_c0_g1_i2.p1  ORF type:complete len:208 (+),score=54.78 TRINITY_DN10394_c0_g1_i2:877-1500(+)